jgi:flagellar biosynthesis/type III secretory pathway M-ring protein FliF/YscJ
MSYDVAGLGLGGEKSGKKKRMAYMAVGAAVAVVVVVLALWALRMI